MLLILRNAVGNGSLEIGPDEFIRVQFWRIAWKKVSMNTGMLLQIGLDDIPLMGLVVVPYDDDMTSKVSLEIGEKFNHFPLADILVGVESDIEPQALHLGRNADTTDGRDLIPIPCHLKMWGVPSRGPRTANRGHQQKAAFINENEMCLKLCGFFLSRATPDISTDRLHARFSPSLASPASGNSIPAPASSARHWQGYSEHESAWRLPPPRVSMSTDPLRSLLSEDLATRFRRAFVSPPETVDKGVQESAWAEVPSDHLRGTVGTTVRRSSGKRAPPGRQSDNCGQL